MVAPPAVATSGTPVRVLTTMQPGSPHTRRRLSYMPSSSSSPSSSVLIPKDLMDRPPLTEYVLLLLQEWLTITKLPATLRCLHDEFTKERKRAPPAMDKWFSLTQQLDLPAPLAGNNATPLLERVVDQALVNAARRRPELLAAAAAAPATTPASSAVVVVASKRPLTAAATSQLKFTSKRSLPMGSTSKSTSALPPPHSLQTTSRPKSAMIVPSSKSSTLAKLDERHDELHSSSNNNNYSSNSNTVSPSRGSVVELPSRRGSSRPISAAPGSLTPHQDSQSGQTPVSSMHKTSSLTSPSADASPNKASSRSSVSSPTGKRPSRLLSLTLSSTRQLLSRTSSNKSLSSRDNAGTTTSDGHAAGASEESLLLLQQLAPLDSGDAPPLQQDTDPAPAMELEDMNEERLTEQFGAFSKGTIKKLRRVLAKASAHSQELTKTRRAMDKIQLRAQQQHQRCAFAAQQTQLLSSTMDSLTKEPCSLCRFVFLKKNLATKVSYKSICDLRAAWAQHAKKRERTQTDPHVRQATNHGPETDDELGQDEELLIATQAQAHTQPLESAHQISHLYDEVPVCVFCAQLVLDFASYRPSSTEKKKQQEVKRRLAVEALRQKDAQRQRDKLKCDPLAFHAYELNSDDDDGGHSDGDGESVACATEEVLEVDADGRVHVVRRRRRRRRTVRTPAQTGFVSKRLHYDHLRSQSVHALNKKEWQVISQEKPTGS